MKRICEKTISGKHIYQKDKAIGYHKCILCGIVDDTKQLEENPIKIQRDKKEEARILGKRPE